MSDEEFPAPALSGSSPEMTATELYKSAVANVRKSAKRIPPPRSSNRQEFNGGSDGAALIPVDAEDHAPTQAGWLVDDTVNSPVKKKQRVHNQRLVSR